MKLGNIDCIKKGDVFEVTSGTITILYYENAKKIYVKHNDEYAHCMWTSKTSIKEGELKTPITGVLRALGILELENILQ